jgi:hypothetical protein
MDKGVPTSTMDPRPTVDVENLYFSEELYKQRMKVLRKHIHSSHETRRLVQSYRILQHKKMYEHFKCTKKDAESYSEDPSPYESSHIFYCLTEQ